MAGLLRGDGARLGDERPLVLRLAADLAARGDLLGRQAHRDVDVVGRALGAVEVGVLGLLGNAGAEPRARDGLDAGGDVLVALACPDRVEGHAQRLQRRGAEAVDGAGRDVVIEARDERGVAADVVGLLADGGGGAHHHVVGLGEVDAGVALDQRAQRGGSELVGADAYERALERASDRGADSVHDHCFRHVMLLGLVGCAPGGRTPRGCLSHRRRTRRSLPGIHSARCTPPT